MAGGDGLLQLILLNYGIYYLIYKIYLPVIKIYIVQILREGFLCRIHIKPYNLTHQLAKRLVLILALIILLRAKL